MFRKVLPLISLGLMCSAEAPSHIQSPYSEKSSEHAISTQSFHRDDVPLSYKYSSVHIYTTAKPQPHTKEHSYSHSGHHSAAPSYYLNNDHQSQDHQYKHYVPVETVVPQKPETQPSGQSYEVNDYEANSPSYETKYVQPQPLVVSEPKQYYRPSYLPPAKSESHSQLASVVKIPSHNYLHYNQQQSVHTRPSQNYLPVSLYQPHQQVSASAPAQQHAEYQTNENQDKKTVVLYSVIPSSQHTHAPSRYQYQQQSASASQFEPKPSGVPLVYFKVGQSNGHSSPFYTNAKGHKVHSVPTAAHTQEASTYQYDIKPSPYMFLLQKHRE